MKILEPVKFKNLELKNRLEWLPAVSLLADEEGYVTDELIARHVARAKGGFGLIDVEATGVNARKSPKLLRISDDKFIPGLKKMTDAVHEYGCKMTVQLIHYVKQSVKTGWKYPIEDFPIENGEIGKDGVEDSIAAIKRDFVEAAVRAKEAGFDGIELHAAHGYTLSSFVSLLNKRKDQYGGNEEGRGRIVTEIIEECRKALGPDYCIGVRISGEEFVIGGNTIKHTPKLGQLFAKAGADFISVSAGGKTEDGAWYKGYSGSRCMPPANLPEGCHVYLAEAMKKGLVEIGSNCPVIVSGKIPSLEYGEDLLNKGICDIVGVCRPALADPDWITKQVEGRQKDIQKCVYCNLCLEADQRHEPVICYVAEAKKKAMAAKAAQ